MLKRREFLGSMAALAGLPAFSQEPAKTPRTGARPPDIRGRKPLAVVCSTYYPLSHAYHIAGRFLHGYYLNGKHHVPDHYIHSVYTHQIPENDVSRNLAKTFGFKLAKDIPSALLDSKGSLDVDGVMLIVEHGDYPLNKMGQILYPRFEFFEEVVQVFKKTGKTVPVFNDKHLSITWEKASQMVRWSKELGFPFMAGSSLPFVWRKPQLELPLQSPVKEALVAAYSRIEIYGLHSLEILQTMLERRKGGETGVKSVQCLRGNAVWKAADEGRISWKLLDAALSRSETLNPGDIRINTGAVKSLTIPQMGPIAFLIEYRDGTKGTVLLLNGHIQDFCFAAQVEGITKAQSCLFQLPIPPGAKFFDAQVYNLEKLFSKKASPIPAERTLVTSGILARAMESDYLKQVKLDTPEIEVAYNAPADSGFLRGPINASED
ncbi:MAG: hypothetical protein EXR99_14145 [Gemmataceae bacterium]|nr:hypothetical protein [Gemmataceae bacterium]